MLQLNFNPFPELETERLLLRRLLMKDVEEIFFLRSDETVLRFIDREPAKTLKEAEEYIERINNGIDENEFVLWAITLKENPSRLIGTICFWQLQKEHFRAETGYVLHPDFWRKGIMTEALMKIIEYGFDVIQLHSIEARISPGNKASAAVLEKTGFIQEAHFKEDFFFNGKFLDTIVYSLITTDK
jgi:ribosomal-protein-alanine N-acetyltransferase